MFRMSMLLVLPALLALGASRSQAQVFLPPPPPTTTVTYYPPTTVTYSAPATPVTVTTYSPGILPWRRRVTVTTYGAAAPAVAVPVPVAPVRSAYFPVCPP